MASIKTDRLRPADQFEIDLEGWNSANESILVRIALTFISWHGMRAYCLNDMGYGVLADRIEMERGILTRLRLAEVSTLA